MASRKEGGFTLTEDELLAHVMFLQAAYLNHHESEPQAISLYKFDVEGTSGFLVTLNSVDKLAHVCPFADVPETMRPDSLAATVQCTPLQILTMLSGGAADLKLSNASDMPALQSFLRSFDFSGYTAFCEARHIRAFEPSMLEAEPDELGEKIRKSVVTIKDGVLNFSQSVSQRLSAARNSKNGRLESVSVSSTAEETGSEDVNGEAANNFVAADVPDAEVLDTEIKKDALEPPSKDHFGEWRAKMQARASGALTLAKKNISVAGGCYSALAAVLRTCVEPITPPSPAGSRLSAAGNRLGERVSEARQSRGANNRSSPHGGDDGSAQVDSSSLQEEQLAGLVRS